MSVADPELAPTLTYLDTSAGMKLLIQESESEALVAELSGGQPRRLVASWLLHTELHCAAGRHPQFVDRASAQAVLATVDLVDVTRGDLIAAGAFAPLRSNDAIHLAAAVRMAVAELLTYDRELGEAATNVGLHVLAPQ